MKTGTKSVIAGIVLLALAAGIGIGTLSTPGAPDDDVGRGEVARLEERVRDLERENEELRKRAGEVEPAPPEVVRKSAKVRPDDESPTPAPDAAPADPAPGAGATGTLRVKVVDESGHPLSGVRVSTRFEQEKKTRTNARGEAEIDGLVPGSRFIWVGTGDGSWSGRMSVEPGGTLEVPVTLGKGRAMVEGTVRHRDRGLLAGVSMALHLRSKEAGSRTLRTETNAEGRFHFSEVPAGTYGLTAYHRELTGRVLQKQIEVAAGETVVVDFVAGTVSLSGTVTDEEDRPIPGVRITAQSAGASSVKTDENGRYEILDLIEGKTTVHASADGYGIEFRHGVEITGAPATLDFRLRRAATLNLVVRVGDEPYTGKLYFGISPAAGTEGTRVGTGLTTDDQGRASYRKIVPGVYTLRFKTYDDKLAATMSVTVGPGETSLEVELRAP